MEVLRFYRYVVVIGVGVSYLARPPSGSPGWTLRGYEHAERFTDPAAARKAVIQYFSQRQHTPYIGMHRIIKIDRD